MPDEDALERRLEAVERTLADGDHDVEALREAADVRERVERLESTVADLRERADDLDAATQALRGYVGNVRSVNRDVERRADAALAAVDRLESDADASAPSEGDSASAPDDAVSTATDHGAATAPDARPSFERDTDSAHGPRTDRSREPDRPGRQRPCPCCSDRPRTEPGSASGRARRSDGSETTDGCEATDGPEPGTWPSESPSPREEPPETPATTRSEPDRDERGALDRIRALLA